MYRFSIVPKWWYVPKWSCIDLALTPKTDEKIDRASASTSAVCIISQRRPLDTSVAVIIRLPVTSRPGWLAQIARITVPSRAVRGRVARGAAAYINKQRAAIYVN